MESLDWIAIRDLRVDCVIGIFAEESLRVTLADGHSDGSFIAEVLVKNGFRVKSLKQEEIDLEDVFMGITKGITN